MIHEDAARKVHPGACEFQPVRHFLRVTLGWTFEIPREGEASVDYGWVTNDGDASQDKLGRKIDAERALKAYLPVRREMEAQERRRTMAKRRLQA